MSKDKKREAKDPKHCGCGEDKEKEQKKECKCDCEEVIRKETRG